MSKSTKKETVTVERINRREDRYQKVGDQIPSWKLKLGCASLVLISFLAIVLICKILGVFLLALPWILLMMAVIFGLIYLYYFLKNKFF